MEDSDQKIVDVLTVIQESLDRRFSRNNNQAYLEAKKKLGEAINILNHAFF